MIMLKLVAFGIDFLFEICFNKVSPIRGVGGRCKLLKGMGQPEEDSE
jgi:hypothetical protein